jgi:hypothetical protein
VQSQPPQGDGARTANRSRPSRSRLGTDCSSLLALYRGKFWLYEGSCVKPGHTSSVGVPSTLGERAHRQSHVGRCVYGHARAADAPENAVDLVNLRVACRRDAGACHGRACVG